MRKRINWEEIRNKYVYGTEKGGKLEFLTIKDLSEEYGVGKREIERHSSKEGWVGAREKYVGERSEKCRQNVIDSVSEKIAPLDTYLFEKLDQFIRGIGGMINNIFPVDIKETQEPLKASDIIVVKTSDLLNIITSLRSAKELEKAVLGEGTKGDKNLADELLALLGKDANDR